MSLPGALYFPAVHSTGTLVPSHFIPATQYEQILRIVEELPPLVHEPAGHTLQLPAPALEYFRSSPHSWQMKLPAGLNLPGAQITATLDPLHLDPAGHAEHESRVFVSPPDVREPGTHVSHDDAAEPEYFVSLPHAVHVELPRKSLNFPGAQDVKALVPVQKKPTGQRVQAVRV